MIKPNIIRFPAEGVRKFRIKPIKVWLSSLSLPKRSDIVSFIYAVITFALSNAKILGNLTPFGTAFFAVICKGKNLSVSFAALSLGSLIAHPSPIALCYILTGGAIAGLTMLSDKKFPITFRATATGVILFATKFFASLYGGVLIYDVIINATEAVFVSVAVLIAEKSSGVFFSAKKRTFLSHGETVSAVAFLSVIALSLGSLPDIFGVNPGRVASVFLILILADITGSSAGAIAGIVAGGINSVASYNSGAIIGAYAFASLTASLSSSFGKVGTLLGFILGNASLTMFLNGSTEVLIPIADTLVAGAVFLATQKSLSPRVSELLKIGNYGLSKGDKVAVNISADRLRKLSKALSSLADAFAVTDGDNASNIANLINRTAEKACSGCSLRFCCWKKKTAETKEAVFRLISIAERNGKVAVPDVPEELKNRCIRTERLVEEFNDSYEMYRTARLWQSKVGDIKALTATQMWNISHLLEEMSEEVHLAPDEETSVAIRSAIDCRGLSPVSITPYLRRDTTLVVEVKFEQDKYYDDIKHIIPACIGEAVGIKMRFADMYKDGVFVHLTFCARERFFRTSGGGCIKKDGEKVCGDSFTSLNLPDGIYISAISDGMGSGEEAQKESRRTIELIKNLVRCGFDPVNTVKLINSALSSSGRGDMFSTVDLCSVNMHNGRADFIKVGGASTYIKSDSGVEKLSSPSLPAGVCPDIPPCKFTRQLKGDTVIVMVSDGVENASPDSSWLEKGLLEIDSVNPHIIADKILDLAMKAGGGRAKDDMTVIVSRIKSETV